MAGIHSTRSSTDEKFFCIEVECVATGLRHDERAVARILIVDQFENVVFIKIVKVESKIFSYLTPLTGLREGDLEGGVSFEEAVTEVKKILGPEVILIGQGIEHKIKLLSLVQGVDYQKYVNLGELFRSNRPPYGRITYFTLRHEANILLQQGAITDKHDAVANGTVSIKLYKKYYHDPSSLLLAKQKLLFTPVSSTTWTKRNNYCWEGVCMAAFMPSKCFCGAPTFHKD